MTCLLEARPRSTARWLHLRPGVGLLASVLLALAPGCGSNDTPLDANGAGAAGGSGGSGTGSGGAGGTGGGGPVDPCSPEAAPIPATATTYYIAIAEPGADNSACDGLAPTNEGGGHCPFRDFSSPNTRSLLVGASGVGVVLRAGTYVISGWDGLRVEGAGSSESERVVLAAYPGETVVFDVPSPDGAACMTGDPTTNPDCVRQVMRVAGQYTWVQGIRIQNGLGYDAEVNGGAHHVLRCMNFGYTAEFPMRSDQLKIDGGATDVLVQHSEFSGWRSQAIDMTEVFDVIIEENDFHDPYDADGGATGTKFGSRNVIIRNNTIHDLGPDPQSHVFSLGGTGTDHPDAYEAEEVHVIGNRVSNIHGILAQFVSCLNCSVENNDLSGAAAGILLSQSATGLPECTASPQGCGATTGARIAGNRMRALDGGGDPAQANIFIVAEQGEANLLEAGNNLYCAPAAADARFGWGNMGWVDFATWQSLSGTDSTSQTAADADPLCNF